MSEKDTLILAIESSCDETAASVLRGAVTNSWADVDITAMALQALAPYREQYQEVIDAALNALSAAQTVTGGFESWGAQSSESCAQVILALTALNIDPTADERFQKNQRNVVEALMDFRLSDGGFAHEKDGPLDAMACEQAMQALTAMELRQQGCGYSLRLPERSYERARALLDRAGLSYRRVYRRQDGQWQEVRS